MNTQFQRATAASQLLAFILMLGTVAGNFAPVAFAQDAPDASSAQVTTDSSSEPADTGIDTTQTDTNNTPPPPTDGEENTQADETQVEEQEPPVFETQQLNVVNDEPEIPSNAEPISAEDLELLNEGAQGTSFFFGDPSLVIEKELINDNGGTGVITDFSVTIKKYQRFLLIFWIPDGTETLAFDGDGVLELEADRGHRYVITEVDAPSYETTYSDEEDECDFTFPFIGSPTRTCTITNDDVVPPPPVVPECNLGDETTFDPFALGSVNGQGGWSSTGPYDQEVVENTYGFASFGCKSLRISNAVTSGAFGNQTFSYETATEAGEAGDSHFEAEFDIATTKPTVQSGLSLSVSPDDGNGSRMSYLRFDDQADGIHVFFYDVENAGPLNTASNFVQTEIATLDRNAPHSVKFSIDFIDGPGNDIVEIYIDGVLEHTGTTWEDYYRYDPEQNGNGNQLFPVDQLLFRAGGTAVTANDGEGFLFDNVSLSTDNEEPQSCLLVSDDVDTYVGFVPATATFEHSAWSDELDSDGAEWIWNAALVSDPTQSETVTFTREFTAANAGTATLEIASDNTHTVTVNGSPVSCGGATQPNYGSVGGDNTCSFPVVAGPNIVEFEVTNTATPGDSNPQNNPAGLYYRISIANNSCTDVPPVPTSDVMLCKVDTEGAALPGWQLYLKGTNVQDDLSVPTNTSSGVNSNPLIAGAQYLVTAMGTWTNQGGANVVDTEYSTIDGWATHMDGYDGYQTDILELQINGAFDPDSDWGPYNTSHTYSQLFTPAASGPANFRIFDGSGTTQNEGWFGDNGGNLLVDIDNAFGGTTGENGCVTLTDIPYGTYEIGEIAQEDWILDSVRDGETVLTGTSVNIDEPTETFTLVNQDLSIEPTQCEITSDTGTLEAGSASFIQEFIHESWDAIIAGAEWIWGDEAIVDPVGSETQTFTKTFWLDELPATDGTLEIAADNTYVVTLNGTEIGNDGAEDNYTSADTVTVPVSALELGANTLEITVTNLAMGGGTEETNPAGLKYKLTLDVDSCSEDVPTAQSFKVHIFKYLASEAGEAQVPNDYGDVLFPMVATYSIAGVGAGSDPYPLGNGGGVGGSDDGLLYAANTIPLAPGDDYGTYENTDGSVVLPADAACVPGKYRLVGYREGNTLIEAQNDAISTVAPSYTDLTNHKYVIVVNEDCGDPLPPEEPEEVTVTVTDDTSAGENQPGWLFNRDLTTQSPFEFVAGVASIGTGSLFIEPITNTLNGNSDKFIGELFLLTDIADIDSITYDFQIDAPDASVEEHFYMSVYANFGESSPTKFYDCRYSVIPTVGSDGSFTTVTFDPTQSYPVTTRGGAEASPYACPSIPADMDDLSPGSSIRVISLNVGDSSGSDTGISGYLDNVVVSTDSVVTTYDFEPAEEEEPVVTEDEDEGNRSGSRSARSNPPGQVLGASTDGLVLGNTCPLITLYMREGLPNDPSQVSALQTFLNGELGLSLVANGVFDALTTNAVKAFQAKYASEVLAPWGPFGYDPNKPTGYVFKTTLWKVNDIACPDVDTPFPTLP